MKYHVRSKRRIKGSRRKERKERLNPRNTVHESRAISPLHSRDALNANIDCTLFVMVLEGEYLKKSLCTLWERMERKNEKKVEYLSRGFSRVSKERRETSTSQGKEGRKEIKQRHFILHGFELISK